MYDLARVSQDRRQQVPSKISKATRFSATNFERAKGGCFARVTPSLDRPQRVIRDALDRCAKQTNAEPGIGPRQHRDDDHIPAQAYEIGTFRPKLQGFVAHHIGSITPTTW
jgi:hypothetical protein